MRVAEAVEEIEPEPARGARLGTIGQGVGEEPAPSSPPARRVLFPPDAEEEAQCRESAGLRDYEIPAGYHCDPACDPSGDPWSRTGPQDFKELDERHRITAAMVTGIELHRYGTLNENVVKMPARPHLAFWPATETLPRVLRACLL